MARTLTAPGSHALPTAAPPEEAAVETPAPAAPVRRRKLMKWDGTRPAKVAPRPVPGKGPDGESIASTLFSYLPIVRDDVGNEGWELAVAGTGEIQNEEAFTINEQGHLRYMDTAVYIRDADLDNHFRALEIEDIKRNAAEVGAPSVERDDGVQASTMADKVGQSRSYTTEGPGDD